MSQYLLYDRFLTMDETTGTLKTLWRIVGNSKNAIVQLREHQAIHTLNAFGLSIPSLYIFCRPSQCMDFERQQLVEIHKVCGTNVKIYKYSREVIMVSTSVSLTGSLDNIQNILALRTHARNRVDLSGCGTKEPVSKRIVYKLAVNSEKVRIELQSKLNFFSLTAYPDVELFVPFDAECEHFLNIIFPTNKHLDNSKYTYMSVVAQHYMGNLVRIIETFYGLVQTITSRHSSGPSNIINVQNREPLRDPRAAAQMFLDYVPIMDIIVGRVYENEHCVEYHSAENALTFIIVAVYVRQIPNYIVFLNLEFNGPTIEEFATNAGIIPCANEREMITSFFNFYTNGLISRLLNTDTHFILSTPRYCNNSCFLMRRLIRLKMWHRFAPHVVVDEAGKCVRFSQHSIILLDSVPGAGDSQHTNYHLIENRVIYLPELYNDSEMPAESSPEIHLRNLRPDFAPKYANVVRLLENGTTTSQQPKYLSACNLVHLIYQQEMAGREYGNYSVLLETLIGLSNKLRVPLTMMYSVSTGQMAYRMIFYEYLRNGSFILMDRREARPHFYQAYDRSAVLQSLRRLPVILPAEGYFQGLLGGGAVPPRSVPEGQFFQSLIKRYIPHQMMGNQTENYFNFLTPSERHIPFITTLMDDETAGMRYKYSVLWSRQRFTTAKSIVSFDFRLYHSTLMAVFDIDFGNCGLIYGLELKSFFRTVYPGEEIFEFNPINILRLPYTLIMDNDTLEIVNITRYSDIETRLKDSSCYVVIMSFMCDCMFRPLNATYEPLANIFRTNIAAMNKSRTRVGLHKNILNSICGMLSAYEINTTILHVVSALSRKIILWTVENCLSEEDDDENPGVGLLDHVYNVQSGPPPNLLAIESDSFTYVYNANQRFRYDEDAQANIETIRSRIRKRIVSEVAKCSPRSLDELDQLIDIRVNFATGTLCQVNKRKYYYLRKRRGGGGGGELEIVSNEHVMSKSLVFLNRNRRLIELMRRGQPIKLSYFKHAYNFPETRRLLLWYMMQLRRREDAQHALTTTGIFNELQNFIERPDFTEDAIMYNLYLLFAALRMTHSEEYFVSCICQPAVNLHFRHFTVPERRVFEMSSSVQMPSDKIVTVSGCVELFFKLYAKQQQQQQQR